MATLTEALETEEAVLEPIRRLEQGDRLTRDEFERRYEAMPEVKKAELIEGVVYMPSPTRIEQHGGPQVDVDTWVGTYRAATPGTKAGGNSTVRMDLDNEPQPDSLLMIESSLGGQAEIDDDGYVAGGPELIIEIAASTSSYDLHDKKNAYRRNGVREYVVWRVTDEALDWFVLRQGQYEPLQPDEAGLLRSEVFPGLWLDPEALVRRDMATVLRRLQEGLTSPEHAEFAERLAEAGEEGGE